MVGKTKSMIIKLRDNLHAAAEAAVPTGSRHAGTKTAEIHTPCGPAQNHQMMRELDEEMKNDFQWLINFDLSSVNMQDIDKETHGDGNPEILKTDTSSMDKMKKSNQKRRKYSSYIPYTYSELIKLCLNENGDASVREIYDWISEKFPCLKPSDIAWKNAIRHTLSVNPLFQKQNVHGKRHSWYLQQDYQNFQTKPKRKMETKNLGCTNISGKYILPNTIADSDIYEKDEMSSRYWYTTESDTNQSESITRCTDTMHSSKNDSSEYYELEIPIITEATADSTNYTEPIEVRYLIDETEASIPVHIF